ncbi:MAG: hypothetical protein LC753_06790 [Acidobacteria bacterium]|nr:hypothetical protein [Acidobacteriota bacterium]MCA1649992.1 hypothetical protein [Acidobacteriota bacterium]
MRSANQPNTATGFHIAARGLRQAETRSRDRECDHCEHPLECVEQNRRMGTWLGSFICPNCRAEYLYVYRWSRLMRRSDFYASGRQ